jgi:hypothetical protein
MAANTPEFTLYTNLPAITEWIDAQHALPPMATGDAFVGFSVEIMNRTSYLLRTGVALRGKGQRDEELPRNRAVVLGHMVRLMKLYECLLLKASNVSQLYSHLLPSRARAPCRPASQSKTAAPDTNYLRPIVNRLEYLNQRLDGAHKNTSRLGRELNDANPGPGANYTHVSHKPTSDPRHQSQLCTGGA